MKILFINTNDRIGGAAIAASRLIDELEKRKMECHFLVACKTSNHPNVYSTRNFIGKLFEKLITKITNLLGLQYQFYPFSARTIRKKIEHLQPDVISLHNTHGGYFPTPLFKEIAKTTPVVWTLHDMWSFTGNAAHTFGDLSWRALKNSNHLTSIYPTIGFNTGSWLLRQKQHIYNDSNMTLVTPSRWLYALAVQSPVFIGKNIFQIYNGVDLSLFKPQQHNDVRKRLNIPVNAKVLMFSAEFLENNEWKGGKDLIKTLYKINSSIDYKIHLLIVGGGRLDAINSLSNFKIHRTGYVSNVFLMAGYYTCSDLFLYPTKADNQPNVLVEAIACGTPCVTFDVGGCSEIIIHQHNGMIISPFDCDRMAATIVDLLQDSVKLKQMAINARHTAEEKFSIEMMGAQYLRLFSSLTSYYKN